MAVVLMEGGGILGLKLADAALDVRCCQEEGHWVLDHQRQHRRRVELLGNHQTAYSLL